MNFWCVFEIYTFYLVSKWKKVKSRSWVTRTIFNSNFNFFTPLKVSVYIRNVWIRVQKTEINFA